MSNIDTALKASATVLMATLTVGIGTTGVVGKYFVPKISRVLNSTDLAMTNASYFF